VRRGLFAVAAALAMAPAALAGGPGMMVGAAEDASKSTDLTVAKAKMDLARLAGLDTIRITEQWTKGQTEPTATEFARLRNAADAANLAGIRAMVAVYNQGSSNTPVTPEERAQFAQFAASVVRALPSVKDAIVGNEPNLNTFWMPQFNADGTSASPANYLAVLTETYDAIKAARPDVTVYGGTTSPRGQDCPTCSRQTHSPTEFIRELGAAYRASGRTTPIMDIWAHHPHQDAGGIRPSFDHPGNTTISVPDYPKLVALLGEAFDGTGQPGSTLPILYAEYGVETSVPPEKESLYTGTEVGSLIDPADQGPYYVEALKVAYCQPNVVGFLYFLVTDEPIRSGWQSGVRWADDSAKPSLETVRAAAESTRAGTLTGCPDQTPPTVSLTAPVDGATVSGTVTLSAEASDDVGMNRVEFLVNDKFLRFKALAPYTITWTSSADGPVTLTARALDAVRNAGTSSVTVIVANPPETTIASGPTSPTTATAASFALSSNEAGSTFECRVDGAAFTACTSPAAATVADGQHVFEARAIDPAGNVDPRPASWTWTVDTTPPETRIDSGPSGTTKSTSASLTFSATETGSTFECRLDGAAFAPCSSPQAYSGLAGGMHTFEVRAADPLGNVDQTPAVRTWTISNDMFAASLPLAAGSGRVTGSTAGATREGGEPRHAGDKGGRSVWFTWIAPATGTVTIDTFGSGFDTLLAVYRGDVVSSLTGVTSNNDWGGRQSRVSFSAAAGVVYQIAVDGRRGAYGSYALNWSQP
jgi:hypothetical protein